MTTRHSTRLIHSCMNLTNLRIPTLSSFILIKMVEMNYFHKILTTIWYVLETILTLEISIICLKIVQQEKCKSNVNNWFADIDLRHRSSPYTNKKQESLRSKVNKWTTSIKPTIYLYFYNKWMLISVNRFGKV